MAGLLTTRFALLAAACGAGGAASVGRAEVGRALEEHVRAISVVQANSRLAALLQQVASAAASSKETEGLREQMEALINEVDTNIVPTILDGQKATQDELDKTFNGWKTDNEKSVEKRAVATSKRGQTDACVQHERNILGDYTLEDATEECAAMTAKEDIFLDEPLFPNEVPPTTFTCDMKDATRPCTLEAVEAWEASVNANLVKFNGDVETQRDDWDAKKTRCETRNAFDAKHNNCKGKRTSAWTMTCALNSWVSSNCASKTAYEQVQSNANGSGNSHSNADRQQEYNTAKLVSCLARAFLEDGNSHRLADKEAVRSAASTCAGQTAAANEISLTFGDDGLLTDFPCNGGGLGVSSSDFINDVSGSVSKDSYTESSEYTYPIAACPE